MIKQGDETPGLHNLIHQSIKTCNSDMRKPLLQNIILSGGCANLAGLTERLEQEVKSLCFNYHGVNVINDDGRDNLSWIGGSTLGSLNSFEALWITKDEYNENGHNIINQKGSI